MLPDIYADLRQGASTYLGRDQLELLAVRLCDPERARNFTRSTGKSLLQLTDKECAAKAGVEHSFTLKAAIDIAFPKCADLPGDAVDKQVQDCLVQKAVGNVLRDMLANAYRAGGGT